MNGSIFPALFGNEKLKETVKNGSTEDIKADTDALEKSFYTLSEKLYKQTGGADQGAAGR